MSKHIAFLGAAAAVLGAALPAAAADYYGGGDRPLAFGSRDDVYVDGGRARVERGEDLRPAYDHRRVPGPVVFDERGPGRRFERPADRYDEPGYGRPIAVERPTYGYGFDRPAAFAPGYGDGYRPAPLYRPTAVPIGPAFGDGNVGPDVGCTIEQVQSVTPAGWRKTVTHRTCYRR